MSFKSLMENKENSDILKESTNFTGNSIRTDIVANASW